MTIAMLIFGLLTLCSACGVVFAPKPLNSALFLVLTLFLVAVHYALLGADFIAATQVLVYAGAIMVLVIFVIMLLGMTKGEQPQRRPGRLIAPLVTAGLSFLVIFLGVHFGFKFPVYPPAAPLPVGNTEAVGFTLYTRFFYPLQIIGLLLLGAVIGAVILALEPHRPLPPGRGLRAKRISEGQK